MSHCYTNSKVAYQLRLFLLEAGMAQPLAALGCLQRNSLSMTAPTHIRRLLALAEAAGFRCLIGPDQEHDRFDLLPVVPQYILSIILELHTNRREK